MSVPIVTSVPGTPVQKNGLSFYYADELIQVERASRAREVSRILIKVDPDCRVRVSAPVSATDEQVLVALKKRARWIYQQLREFRVQLTHIRPRHYVSGESHHYLGKQHVLKVIESPDAPQRVRLLRGKIEVSVRKKKPENVRALLLAWYRERARDIFERRLQVVLDQAQWVCGHPALRILTMQTQWGSCSPAGRITLNPHLVKAPRDCIDYVILHELCHIAEHNHSERFYRLMQQVMPQWEKIKQRLDDMAASLLNDTSYVSSIENMEN